MYNVEDVTVIITPCDFSRESIFKKKNNLTETLGYCVLLTAGI